MKKGLIIGGIVLLVAAGAAGIFIWNWMQQPLYTPGMVRAEKNLAAPLTPPVQPAGSPDWLVEPGVRLHHFSDGSGATILVVHGGPGSPFVTPPPGLHALAQRYQFQYYDQRGCGASTRPIDKFDSANTYQNMLALDKTLGLGAQIADIERIRRILGEDKLVLVGHSFGGFLAALYAAEFPEHVRGLVLVDPAEMLVMPVPGGGLFESVKPLLPAAMLSDYDQYLKRYFDFNHLFRYSDGELAGLNAEFTRYYEIAAQAKGYRVPPGQP
ncbi:MAG: alpha/beta fold hydrolase, partial [Anaerolineaceae bacterium]|nr:alpha/beta fold hydrolase [Anaerolineaceae bacterium]